MRAASVLVALALAITLTGCGGDDDSSEPTSTTGAEPSSSTDDSAETPPDDVLSEDPAPPLSLEALALASGDAPAARGAEVDEPPGPDDRRSVPAVEEVAASITAEDGTVTTCCLMVASTDEQRNRGLMEVTDLGGYDGMVFVWDHDTEGAFWMFNTVTPLSIAWFDAEGAFVSSTDMEPCTSEDDSDCPMYPPEGEYRFALEVFQGDLDDLGVGPGSRLALGGPCAGAAGS
ncbi:MAG: DUF192 domain-containing protein [Acidimicrobiales bacterium]|nr:DUF192 domain-containing protein [Acidimicrobiales bacterium]